MKSCIKVLFSNFFRPQPLLHVPLHSALALTLAAQSECQAFSVESLDTNQLQVRTAVPKLISIKP